MSRHFDALHPRGDGGFDCADRPARRNTGQTGDIAGLRPFAAVLCAGDYWLMQEHRRRCEELGGDRFLRLAALIRAKSADAQVVHDNELPSDIVTGTAWITFAIDRNRPETRTLYHWDLPARRLVVPVGTFLGITLIGMAVGQYAPLLDDKGLAGQVRVLAIHAQAAPDRAACI